MKILHSTFPSLQDCLTSATVQDFVSKGRTHFCRVRIEIFHNSRATKLIGMAHSHLDRSLFPLRFPFDESSISNAIMIGNGK